MGAIVAERAPDPDGRSAAGSTWSTRCVVVDDGSIDDTAAGGPAGRGPGGGGRTRRRAARARPWRWRWTRPTPGLLVFLDADVENFGAHFVTGLLGPLLDRRLDVALVKGFYERPAARGARRRGPGDRAGGPARHRPAVPPPGRGRASRWPARRAAPRSVLEKTGLAPGYGVELAPPHRRGRPLRRRAAVAQVDLGVRIHRNRPLSELRPQATDVLRAALGRALPPGTPLPGR